ncbi:MAG: ATP-binding protein [Gammaproteobacteria bacterium]|jgi:signal transduction histidine kinase/CheY-like chemotaxis protein|nr:ATP-binding protein [Gammaproteobacteria bacterium]MDH3749363.1 ATP-binding protein [Gammaproteobacteria bacterium]MDH3803963.1 ATP-binding protein [Gammaproteobacteria bacterium]
MSLPPSVIEYLQSDFVNESRPFCFLVDSDFRLVDSWGDGDWSGLASADVGANMLDHAPFLLGALGSDPQKLSFISTGDGAVVHLITMPHQDGHYAIVLDAGQEHDFRQEKQQSANELRLLHGSQRKLIARQRDLIAELVEAKAELDHHRRDIERSSANKSRFIAMMSHEFRTPLASIINYADLALEPGSGPADIQKSIEAISRSGRHLTSLVDAVLDEARLDAGQIQLRERDFDLFELLDDLAAMMAPLAAEKGLSFATLVDPDVPHKVRADDVCLRQILINLLGNAVKFTQEGSIRLYLTYNDGRLVATVSDTGPGISVADQERVFRAFERGTDRDGSLRGAGLGLTITLQLAKLMRGEISLDSLPGQGCTVSVHVPMAIAEGGAVDDALSPPEEATYATQSKTVLVCDDDEDMLALLEHYLHRAGYALIAASSGTEAVEKAVNYKPDIVLMDVNVPGMSGIDAALALRDQKYAGPIVALTASKLSDDEKNSFTRCFRKPAQMQQLLLEIKDLTHNPES